MLLLIIPVAACATTTGLSGSDAELNQVCTLWTGIQWADADTDQTIREVKGNNAKHAAFCAHRSGVGK